MHHLVMKWANGATCVIGAETHGHDSNFTSKRLDELLESYGPPQVIEVCESGNNHYNKLMEYTPMGEIELPYFNLQTALAEEAEEMELIREGSIEPNDEMLALL